MLLEAPICSEGLFGPRFHELATDMKTSAEEAADIQKYVFRGRAVTQRQQPYVRHGERRQTERRGGGHGHRSSALGQRQPSAAAGAATQQPATGPREQPYDRPAGRHSTRGGHRGGRGRGGGRSNPPTATESRGKKRRE